MPKPKKISLDAIGDEIVKVQKALEAARKDATPTARKAINLRIRKLRKLNTAAKRICSKIWTAWPASKTTRTTKKR